MKVKMKNRGEKKHRYDAGQIFVKIIAAILALLMVIGTVGTLIYALI